MSKNKKLLSQEELKSKIAECEERYHQSFKTNSCKEIMNSFYALQDAKKQYYKSLGKEMPKEDPMQSGNLTESTDDLV